MLNQVITLVLFSLKPVDEDEVCRIIKALKNSSPGWDSISSTVVKNTCHHFVDPLTHLLNASFLLHRALCSLFQPQRALNIIARSISKCKKKAKVIPRFKGGDPSQLSNYRPVSVLPCF